jgi:hypothetical protein
MPRQNGRLYEEIKIALSVLRLIKKMSKLDVERIRNCMFASKYQNVDVLWKYYPDVTSHLLTLLKLDVNGLENYQFVSDSCQLGIFLNKLVFFTSDKENI